MCISEGSDILLKMCNVNIVRNTEEGKIGAS